MKKGACITAFLGFGAVTAAAYFTVNNYISKTETCKVITYSLNTVQCSTGVCFQCRWFVYESNQLYNIVDTKSFNRSDVTIKVCQTKKNGETYQCYSSRDEPGFKQWGSSSSDSNKKATLAVGISLLLIAICALVLFSVTGSSHIRHLDALNHITEETDTEEPDISHEHIEVVQVRYNADVLPL